jgi:threonine dehydrogenase-like Zn-dependent dehydrogenase
MRDSEIDPSKFSICPRCLIGGQTDYVRVSYADFNLLKFPDKPQAVEKIRDLTCLSDILPTGIPRSRHRQGRRRIDGLRRRRRPVDPRSSMSR